MKKLRHIPLILLALFLIAFAGCGDSNYLSWLSDDDSMAACQRQVDLDLDSGNYDAVIASSCSNFMDMGAAYFGLAGFDITQVINTMIDSNESSASALSVYTSELISNVSGQSLRYLELSGDNYALVTQANGYSENLVRDAEFYSIALVNTVSTFSVIKAALDPDGDGVVSECDINDNDNSDEVDVLSCSLLISSGANCASLLVSEDTATYPSLAFDGYANLYNGVVITIDAVIANAACPDSYNQLLYDNGVGTSVAVSSSDVCIDPAYPAMQWMCPFEDAAAEPSSFLDVFNEAIVNSVDLLAGLGYEADSEVFLSINSVAEEACGGAGSLCTEAELSAYIQCQLGAIPCP